MKVSRHLRPASSNLALRLLPLSALAGLVLLGLAIESTLYGTVLWASKVPLAIALLAAFVRARRTEA